MALFLLNLNGPSSCLRILMLALFGLVLTCSFSYCSSSPTYSTGSSPDDIGDINFDIEQKSYGQNYPHYHVALEPSVHDIDAAEHPILSKHRFANLLTKSALLEAEDRLHRQHQTHAENKRYASQAFHAMRG